MERKAFMCDMILTELEDVVGVENVSTSKSDRAAYGVDYFWIGRMWVDRGEKPPCLTGSSGREAAWKYPKS